MVLTTDNIPGVDFEAGKGIGVGNSVITKAGAGYNRTTQEITWRITVNSNKITITNAVVTDTIPDGQVFVANSVTQSVGSFSYSKNDSNKETLTFNLGDINAEQTITFKTKITDLSIFETNGDKQLQNTAKLTNDFGPVVSSTGSITVKNTLVGKVGDYERGNLYIDWLVTINQNLLPLTEAELVDELQEGLALDTSSVKLYKLTLNSDGSLTQGSEVTLNADNISYNGATGEFIFTMPAPAEGEYLGAYLLKFRTDVVDESKSPFTNTISFSGSETEESSNDEKVTIRTQSGGGWAIGETGTLP